MTAPAPVTDDWNLFDPSEYLEEYYADIGSENLALLSFLAEAFRWIPKGGRLLDFGGGPTIYQLISAAPCVDEIHFSDYLEANLEEVRRWIEDHPTSFDWSAFVRTALDLEQSGSCTERDIEIRTRLMRERITGVYRCDAGRAHPLDGPSGTYDILMTNFCAESATSNHDEWRRYMSNITSLLRPGGWMLVAALTGATSYAVGPRTFPAVDITENDLHEVLQDSGFVPEQIRVAFVPADRPTRDYNGLMVASARKSTGRE